MIGIIIKEWKNVIPIKSGDPDTKKNKLPLINWKPYINKPYPKAELKKFEPCNHAVVCGTTNNNLLILDWDFKEGKKSYFKTVYIEFLKTFPKLANTYTVETPHGYHFYYYMDDFLETRHPIKNSLFINSKKLGKEIFTGAIKTKFFKYLAGWDILGQKGYALMPPSKTGDGLDYILKNDTEVCNLTITEFENIKRFFLLDKVKKPRKPFIDLMNGVIEFETYAIETGQKEFVYWKNLFREMWHYCGMEPYEVYRFLEMNQPAFDKDKCDVQLGHHLYTDNPLSTEYMKKYFPNYYTHKTIIKNTEIVLKNLVPDVVFSEDKILQTIENLSSDMTDNKLLVNLFIQIPSSELGFLNKVKTLLSNRLDYYNKNDLNKLITKYVVNVGNIRSVEVRENDYTIEEFNGFAENDDFNLGNILKVIKYDNEYILKTDNGITLYNSSAEFKEVLNKPISLDYKTVDEVLYNTELFTFEFNGFDYRNVSLKDILKQMEPHIQKYGKVGRDIIKKYFNYESVNELAFRNPKYITGWNDGWFLPFNEKDNNFSIINHSEIQEIVYQNIKNNSYQSYSNKEKEVIKQEMKEFLSITQMDENKLSMIIGWSISAPFRLYFIENTNLFTYMYLCGFKGTGKSKIGDFFMTNFYKNIDNHLSSGVLKSPSRFEDYSASTTFPFNVQEVDQSIKPEIVGNMKDMATSKSRMIRKNTDNTIKINKLKVCSMMLDGNEAVQVFLDEAWNSKMLYINFEKDERIIENKKWMDLFHCLKKKKLFSLLYDYTKDWTNKDIEKRINKIDKKYPELLEDLATEDQRLAKTYRFLIFGIKLFEDVFDVELSKDYIYDLLLEGRTQMTMNLMDSFKSYIIEAIELGRRERNDDDRLRNLPSYLKHSINMNTKGEYLFLKTHLRDFELFDKNKYDSLRKLYNLLSESLEDKDLLGYNSKYINKEKRSMRCITFKQNFLKT